MLWSAKEPTQQSAQLAHVVLEELIVKGVTINWFESGIQSKFSLWLHRFQIPNQSYVFRE